jgi:hypothetical protein
METKGEKMKSFISLYFAYLETAFISMLLAALAFISVSGFAYGGSSRIPATLATLTLVLIVWGTIGRHRALKEHPELENQYFKEIRLFFILLQSKVMKMLGRVNWSSKKLALQQFVLKVISILVIAVAGYTIWASFSTSAAIQNLAPNQFVAEADVEIPATFFNKSLMIEVKEISDGSTPSVTAIIHFEGFPDGIINNKSAGYETIYHARDRFIVRIEGVSQSSATFFVERRKE